MKKSFELEAHADVIREKFKQSCAELGIAVRALTLYKLVVCVSNYITNYHGYKLMCILITLSNEVCGV